MPTHLMYDLYVSLRVWKENFIKKLVDFALFGGMLVHQEEQYGLEECDRDASNIKMDAK